MPNIISRENSDQYEIVPVGANWTENRHIVGFYNVITKNYQETAALKLILRAKGSPELPFFLILDEMNLSHVERYFADFLSAMESGETISLYSSNEITSLDQKLEIPNNLYVIGTVNVDETTYMFSPKVLDRANTIEFSTIPAKEYISKNLANQKPAGDIKYLENLLFKYSKEMKKTSIEDLKSYLDNVKTSDNEILWDVLADEIAKFQDSLRIARYDFGFRVINEIMRFMYVAWIYENSPPTWDNWDRYFDSQIKQKMLPKLHGSQRALVDVLQDFFNHCFKEDLNIAPRNFADDNYTILYPQTALKLQEMDKVLYEQRYVSFIN